ncbi:hypothetical protein Taro_016040, partial [Colocasia esculenta]|nr:hypothetical protein [Colocasia esculenta]
LGKTYEIGDMVRKILRSLPSTWTPKVTAIEEANDLKRMSLEKLIGSLMAHEINMERLRESSSRKKHSNALKAEEDRSDESSAEDESSNDCEDEEAMLSRRLQHILAKKKKFQSGRRHFKKNKDFKKPDGKGQKKGEPICYECKKLGHIKAECPKLKKPEFRKRESSKKFRRYKKKAMAAWSNSSDSDSDNPSPPASTSTRFEAFNLSRQKFLEGFSFNHPSRPPEPFLLDSMASSTISGSVGGYGAAFLTAEEQTRFASVMAKVCGHKTVDLVDLEKNGMGSLVEALQRLKWTKIATLSDVSYPDLVKAFYVCLKIEEDGTLTSMVKRTQIRITRELLASLFEVSTFGRSGVHTVDTHVKGLGIIGPEYRLKDGTLDINQLSAFNRLLHFIICQIIVPRSATFSSCTKADSDLMLSVVGNVSEKMGQAIRSRNLRKSGFSVVNGVWSKTGAVEGEAILGETQEDHEPVAEAASVVESAATEVVQAVPAAPAVEEPAEPVAPTPEATVIDESSRRIEDIPPEDIEPIGQFSKVPLPSSQVGSLLRDALDSISQGEPIAQEPSIAKSVAEVHTKDVVMEEAPSQQEQVQILEDVVMEDAPIEGEQSVAEEIQGVSAVASGHTEIHSEVLPVQEEEAAAAAQTEVPMESVHAEEEAEVEKGSETQGEGNENPPENQFREGETASSSDFEDDQDQQPLMDKAQEKGKAAEASTSKELSQVKNAVRWFNKELGSMKTMLSEILKVVGAQAPAPPPPPAAQRNEEDVPRPSGPDEQVAGPSGPAATSPQAEVSGSGPSGPDEQVSGPSGQAEAINALGSADAHIEAIQVDFSTLQVPEEILLPPIHSLVMDSSVGSIIFERFARVMGRIKGVCVPFWCEGRPGGVSRVLFLFGLRREDQLSWVL